MSMIDGKDSAIRKGHPIFSGVLAYFPDALLAVAELSKLGNDKHNPGQPLHWSREKSSDHADCLVRHQLDAGKIDPEWEKLGHKVRHSTEVAWRALAQLQAEIEKAIALEQYAEASAKIAENRNGVPDRRVVAVSPPSGLLQRTATSARRKCDLFLPKK